MVTPPLGMNVYIASSVVDVDLTEAFRGAAMFLIVDVLILAVMVAFPATVLWLPTVIG